MSSPLPTPTTMGGFSETPPLWLRLWHAPTVTIARMALRSYLRSGWVWGECLYVLVAYAAFFSVFAVSMDTFFGIASLSLWALAILGGAILARRMLGASAYLHLAKLPSRAPYVWGLTLATGALRVPLYLLLALLALGTGKILQPEPAPLLIGSLGVVMSSLTISALTIALSPPIGTRIERIIFLAWLFGALYSYTNGPLAGALVILRAPLLPLAATFTMSVTGVVGVAGLLALLADVVLIVAIAWLAAVRLKRRDLVLH